MPSKHVITLICSLFLLMVLVAQPTSAFSADDERNAAQEKARDQEPVTRVFKIEHGNVQQIAEVLVMFGGIPRANKELAVIAWQGPANKLAAVEAAVESLDVPPKAKKNVNLTLFILAALPGSGPASNDLVPDVLQGVTSQIRKLFEFESIRLLESAIIRTRDGEGGGMDGGLSLNRSLTEGMLEGGPLALVNRQGSYHFRFRDVEMVADEEGGTIRVNRLNLEISLPATYIDDEGKERKTARHTELATDIDVREGQKVVVGKTSIEGARETMFLVLTAEVLD